MSRLDAMGDGVMSSSFLAGLRTTYPAAHIAVALAEENARLFECCAAVDRIVPIPRDVPSRWRDLIGGPYDVALCPRWDVDYWSTRHLALLSRAPIRVGFDRGPYAYDSHEDGWAQAYFTHLVSTRSDLHEVEKSWAMLRYLGMTGEGPVPRLSLPTEAMEWASAFSSERACQPYVVLGVAAGSSHRMWPAENFLPVIDTLDDVARLKCIVVGGADARDPGARLADMRPELVTNMGGMTSVTEAAALIANARLYIGMDSGLMHVAAAFQVPVVEISCHPQGGAPDHPCSPTRFGPFSTPHRILRPAVARAPCKDYCRIVHSPHCISQIAAPEVSRACRDLLRI